MACDHLAITELGKLRIPGVLQGLAVDGCHQSDKLCPAGLEHRIILAGLLVFGLQGDFLEPSLFVPIEEQIAENPADLVLGPVDSVESRAPEKGSVEVRLDKFACIELFRDGAPAVSELQGVENRIGIGSRFPSIGRMV